MVRRFGIVVAVALAFAPAAVATPHPMIVGGESSSLADAPAVAAIVDPAAADDLRGQFCGGVLIARAIVATAAHCTLGPAGRFAEPSAFAVVIGRANLAGHGGQRIGVSSIVRQPAFNAELLTGDLALLRLKEPATAQPVAIVGPGQEALWGPGVVGTTLGWGSTNGTAGGAAYPAVVQRLTLAIRDDGYCASVFAATFDPAASLCAGGAAGRDTCDGDSGGPLLVSDGASGWLLAGLTSYGDAKGCGVGSPAVFTRLASYRDWIARVGKGPALTPVDLRDGVLHVDWSASSPLVDGETIDLLIEPGHVSALLTAERGGIDQPALPRDVPLVIQARRTDATGTTIVDERTTEIIGRPRATGRPAIDGAVRAGRTVACSGAWAGILPINLRYAWKLDGRRTLAHGRRLRLRRLQRGHRLTCVIDARNPDGTTSARSRAVRVE